MYSYEDRIRAVQLYIDCGKRAATVVRRLGYPSKKNLRRWYLLYVESGNLTVRRKRKSKYSLAQKHDAMEHYFKSGQCLAHTRRTLGYPCASSVLSSWIDQLRPSARQSVTSNFTGIQAWTANQKQHAVIELCTRPSATADIANDMGVSRQSLYKWKEELLDKPIKPSMKNHNPLNTDKNSNELEQEVASLQLQIHRLQLERDILTKDNFELNSVSYNTEISEGISTMSADSSCTVRAKVRIAGQEAEVSATTPTCTEAYQMLKDLFGNMAS